MDRTYRVIITEEALADLGEIAAYIHQKSPQNALLVADRLIGMIDSLAQMPGRFKRVGKSRARDSDVHAAVVWPHLIYYRVNESPPTVTILTVRHGARQQPSRFD